MGNENSTLTAVWQANSYTITLDGQGATKEGTTSATVTYGAPMPSITLPEKTGSNFDGYYSDTNTYYMPDGTSQATWDVDSDTTLYARWVPVEYEITLDNQGATKEGTTRTTAIYGSDMPSITLPEKTGYNFGGYYTEVNGGGTQYYNADGASARTWNVTTAKTLYAKWTAGDYEVTLDNQGATTAGTESVTVTYDGNMPEITLPGKTGYDFGGYYTEVNGGGTQYYKADGTSARTYNIATNSTLYAKWIAKTYTVTLDNQGATTAGSTSVAATYNANMPSITLPTKTGYDFGGYYTEVNGGGTQYYKADGTSARTYNIADSTTLYAKWTAKTYTVTLDNQGATTAGSESVTVTYNANMPSITLPTKTGYDFGGYYTEVNGGGTQYYNADGASARTYNVSSNSTLYAKWTAKTYTVTLDNQSATTAGSLSVTATYGDNMPTITKPEKRGYDFGGYYSQVNGGGTQYYKADGTSARTYNIASNTTLYAKWIPKTYTVTLDNQGATKAGSLSVTATFEANMPSITLPEKTGYSFGGYYSGANGSGTQYYKADGTSARTYNIADSTTLYAKWIPKTYTVTLDNQSATKAGSLSVTATYNANMPSITLPEKTGYTFGGYYTEVNGGGTRYYNADGSSARTYNIASNTTLYAKWIGNQYEISFDSQDASKAGSLSVTATYNANMPSITLPEKTGYTFSGYYTAVNGGGTQYYKADGTSARTYNIASNTTLYANWIAKTYTVTLDGQGATKAGSLSVTATYNANMPSITLPEKTGYTFGGYYTAVNGGGTQYYKADGTSAKAWNIASNTTLYANWIAKTYTVTLDGQEATISGTTSVTATYGANMPSITKPSKTCHSFGGYYTAVSGGGTQYYKLDGTSAKAWNIASNTTLYAKWVINSYNVSINPNGGSWNSLTTISSLTKDCGSQTTIANPTRTYYTFDGWTITGEGSSIAGTMFTMGSGAATLTAKWVPKSFNLTIDPNGGTWNETTEISSSTKQYTKTYTIANPTRTGYTFGGWDITGGGSSITGTTLTMGYENTKLTAKWNGIQYNVTLDNQSATTAGSTSVTATYGSSMPSITKPTKTNYTFGGYYTAVNGGGTQYYKADGTSAKAWDVTSNTTLYAKWTNDVYTVSLDDQSATTHGSSSVIATIGSDMPSIDLPTKTCYTFGGYYTAVNGGGTQYYKADGTSARTYNIASNTTLYAKWVIKSHTLTIKPNGGIWNSTSSNSVIPLNCGATTTVDNPTRDYYTFGSWSLSGTGSTFSSKLFTMGDADASLTASWTANSYTVILDTAGGAWNGQSGEIRLERQYKKTYIIENPSRTGYNFAKWIVTGGGTSMSGTTLTMGYENSRLTASWTAKQYTVTLDNQGATTAGSGSVTATYDSAMPSMTAPEKTGYVFGGYYTETNGGGTQYYTDTGASAKSWSIADNATLYAKWIPVTYAVTLNNQGATKAGSTSVTATYGANMPSITLPEKTGYAFGGYYTETNGGGTQYYTSTGASAKVWSILSNTTLYAKWIANSYTVTLNNQGATTAGTASVTATYGSAMPSITKPSKTGYTFVGYYSGTNGSGTQYYTSTGASASNWNLTSATTLYAKWAANVYTVTLNNQSATTAGTTAYYYRYNSTSVIDGVTVYYYSDSTLTTPLSNGYFISVPSKTGYTFGGYYTETNGTGTKYVDADGTCVNNIYQVPSSTTLYAKWTAKSYTVSFNEQGATTSGTLSTSATYGANMPSITNPAKTGYIFNGYYTSTNGGGTKYYTKDGTSARTWNIASNTTLYASWAGVSYEVSFDDQGATTAGTAKVTATYGSSMPSITKPTKTNYTFGGYYTAVNGGGTQYYKTDGTSATSWNVTSNTTLYAKWIGNQVTITLDNQSATTAGTTSVAGTIGSAMPSITKPAKTGYTFGGYYTSTGGNGTQYYKADGTSAKNWDKTVATTLYAKWLSLSYTVTLDGNGATTAGTPSVTATYGANMPSITKPAKTGYTFGGYYTEINGGGTQYYKADGTSAKNWDITYNDVLYAKWTQNNYTLTIDANGGSWSGTTPQSMAYESTSSIANPTKSGYTFDGWTVTGAGSSIDFTGVFTMGYENATITAKWTANKYEVTLDNQNAIIYGTSSVWATYGSAMPSITVPTKTGYTFGGYYTETNGSGIQYYNSGGTSVKNWDKTVATTLYAKWLSLSYTVTLDGNGATTAGTPSVTATYGANMPSITIPTKTCYSFIGYYTSIGVGGAGTKYYNSDGTSFRTYNIASDTTLYANWNIKSFTVTVDANGGSWSGTTPQTINCGSTTTIANPTRTGYTFDGWTITGEGSSITGTTLTMGSASVTLTAKWKINSYQLTIKPNGGTWNSSSNDSIFSMNYEETMTIAEPTRTGYTFGGWTVTGVGSYIKATGVFKMGYENTTLTPHWQGIGYTVTLNNQNATTAGTTSVTGTYGSAMPSITKPAKTGYAFGGYYTGTNGSGTKYYNSDGTSAKNWDITAATTLYANWLSNAYTVTLDNQSATTAGTASVTATYGANMPSITAPSKTCYAFGGYYTSTGGSGTQYYTNAGASARTWNLTSATTLYAKWTIISNNVTIKPNGGTWNSTTNDSTMAKNCGSTTTIANPTRTYYDFSSWTVSGTGSSINASGVLTMGSTATTLTAKWTAKSYSLTINPNGGTWGGTTANSTSSKQYKKTYTIENPTKPGYTFDGWTVTGGETSMSGTTLIMGHEASTLTAKWTANTYTVTLDNQSATTAGTASVTGTYGSAMPSITIPTKTGHIFGGYYTETSGSGTQYYKADGTSAKNWDIASATTLYAKWTTDTYILTINANGGSWSGTTPQTINYGSTATIANPTRTGYTFDGWTVAGSGSSINGTTFTMGYENAIITAKWTANTYALTLDGQSATTAGTTSVTATYDAAMPSITKPTKTCYTFSGYYYPETAGTQYYTSAGASARTWNVASTATLKAKWTIITNNVTIKPNGGTWNSTTNDSTLSKNCGSTTTIANPTRTGYTFDGWTVAGSGSSISETTLTMGSAATTLTANWTAAPFTLTVNANGGSWSGTTPQTINYGSTATIANPTRTGYTFDGWTVAGSGSSINGTTFTMGYENAIITAKWTANTYALTLDGQSATTAGTTSVTATYDAAMPSITKPTKTCYTFSGYYYPETAGTQYYTSAGASARTWNVASTATLKAKWTIITNNVTIKPNGGTWNSTTSDSTLSKNCGSTTTIANPTRTGYTFGGWTVAGTGSSISGTTLTMGSATTTLTANWTKNNYTLTVNANGGSWSGTTPQTIAYGSTSTIANPTRTGYTFGGWTVAGAGSSISGTTFTMGYENATITAKWTGIGYTVTLNNQSATTAGTASVTGTYGSAMPSITKPTKTGYTFGGYYTGTSGSGTQYYKADGTSARAWNIASATTLYANWTKDNYTLTVNANGGSWSGTTPQTIAYGATVTIANPTRTGYTFGGWTVTGTGSSISGTTFTMGSGAATLTAKWTKNSYTLTVNANGGSWSGTTPQTIAYGSTSTIANPTRTGYTFDGWTVAGAGSNISGTTFTMGYENATITAKWTGIGYTVTLDNQSATTAGTASVTGTYGSAMPSITLPTKTGYAFGGYYTSTGGSGTQYYNSDGTSTRNWNLTSATTLYANWLSNAYTVTLDNQSATTAGTESVTATYGANMPSITMPVRTCYAFGGYYTETNGSGTQYYTNVGASARTWNLTSAATLYAKWTIISKTVTIKPNGGTWYNTTNDSTWTMNCGTSMSVPNPTRTGYTFAGWTGGHTISVQGHPMLINIKEDVTLIANWTKDNYTLTVNSNGGSWSGTTPQTIAYGATATIGNPTRTGYTFSGWTVAGAGSSISGTTFTMGYENATLTANWTKNSYTLTVNANGGSWSGTTPQTIAYGSTSTIGNPTKTGYTFSGWTVSGAGSSINSSGVFTMGYDNTTITAKWTKNSYTLTVSANGGSWSGTTPQTIAYGATATIANPTRTGYTFGGWTVSGTGSSISGTTFTMGVANATLTAKWTKNSYTLTVNANGGSWSGTTPQTIAYGSTATIANPTRVGYTFDGWTVSGAGSGMSGTTFTMGYENAILTAKWSFKEADFQYTQNVEQFTAPVSGYYRIELWGAQGGNSNSEYAGGLGGYVSGIVELNANEVLYINVGGQGETCAPSSPTATCPGGYNGGGSGFTSSATSIVAGGGGATDIRYNGTDLKDRIMVAAGGGGGNYSSANANGIGGDGGGLLGLKPTDLGSANIVEANTNKRANGGTQIAGGCNDADETCGTFGIGGSRTVSGSGGGAGYYGGAGASTGPGGGGSSYISGASGVNSINSSGTSTNNTIHYSNKYFIDTKFKSGDNEGNGKAKITYVPSEILNSRNQNFNNVRYIKDCAKGNNVNTSKHWVELQAISNGTNVAYGKTVTGTVNETSARPYSRLVDADLTSNLYTNITTIGNQCLTVDLGQTYNLDEITVWHYWNDNRTYYGNITYASSDGATWNEVINEVDYENSDGKRKSAYELGTDNSYNYQYSGEANKIFTPSKPGYYKIEVWGAQGGDATSEYFGGLGGYASGVIELNTSDTLYINVGGQGAICTATSCAGGYNGGGDGVFPSSHATYYSASGGGATDIRYNGTDLKNRIMVAAGGGGGYYASTTSHGTGGSGGGLWGLNPINIGSYNDSTDYPTRKTNRGTQAAGGCSNSNTYCGAFGQGGTGGPGGSGGSGGGAGYYGGSGALLGPGAGGSSYISGASGANSVDSSGTSTNNTIHYSNKYFIDTQFKDGYNQGNGKVKITYISNSQPEKTNSHLNGVRYIKNCINGSSLNENNHWVELQAINGGVNVALNKTVTGSKAVYSGSPYSRIVDGDITSTLYARANEITGNTCVTVDLGQTYNLDELTVWHYWAGANTRYYKNNVTSVSSDNSTWTVIFHAQQTETFNGLKTSAYKNLNG